MARWFTNPWVKVLAVIACYVVIEWCFQRSDQPGNTVGALLSTGILLCKFGGYFWLMPTASELLGKP